MMSEVKKQKARLIAFYLPQYHPIPENDRWWGKGFTEWTNVTKAKPLYPDHHQPNLPADLGFYDLRVPEVRIAQAELASKYGIEAFCYWHYWFGHGKRILERPFNEVLKTGEPDFPFCLGWANESWSGIWHGAPDKVLMQQEYPGLQDYTDHFYSIVEALADKRYLTVDGKKLFVVYRPLKIPDAKVFTEHWRTLAQKEGIGELFFVGVAENWNPKTYGFDASVSNAPGVQVKKLPMKWDKGVSSILTKLFKKRQKKPRVYQYQDLVNSHLNETLNEWEFPIVIPNWDNTPRSGIRGIVLENPTPQLFGEMLRKAIQKIEHRHPSHRIIFVKSWNEWAEGNYLEPDQKFGNGFLEVIRKEVYPEYAKNIGR